MAGDVEERDDPMALAPLACGEDAMLANFWKLKSELDGIDSRGERVAASILAGSLLPIVEFKKDTVVVEDGDGCRYEIPRADIIIE